MCEEHDSGRKTAAMHLSRPAAMLLSRPAAIYPITIDPLFGIGVRGYIYIYIKSSFSSTPTPDLADF